MCFAAGAPTGSWNQCSERWIVFCSSGLLRGSIGQRRVARPSMWTPSAATRSASYGPDCKWSVVDALRHPVQNAHRWLVVRHAAALVLTQVVHRGDDFPHAHRRTDPEPLLAAVLEQLDQVGQVGVRRRLGDRIAIVVVLHRAWFKRA